MYNENKQKQYVRYQTIYIFRSDKFYEELANTQDFLPKYYLIIGKPITKRDWLDLCRKKRVEKDM
ncbi:hypothetical protein KSI01_11110 [Kurthia sibirica]|nr:hypothetical protein KSI01_11110 [Kurthia sibirica]